MEVTAMTYKCTTEKISFEELAKKLEGLNLNESIDFINGQ